MNIDKNGYIVEGEQEALSAPKGSPETEQAVRDAFTDIASLTLDPQQSGWGSAEREIWYHALETIDEAISTREMTKVRVEEIDDEICGGVRVENQRWIDATLKEGSIDPATWHIWSVIMGTDPDPDDGLFEASVEAAVRRHMQGIAYINIGDLSIGRKEIMDKHLAEEAIEQFCLLPAQRAVGDLQHDFWLLNGVNNPGPHVSA